jgi:hypothetical protein
LPIEFDQSGEDWGEEVSHPVKAIDETARVDLQLFTDASQRDSMQIRHRDGIGHELVAIEVFGEHSGGRRLEDASTLGAIAFGEPVDHGGSPKGATFHDEPLGVALIHERRATLRADISDRGNDGTSLSSPNEIGTRTSSSQVAESSSFGFALFFLSPIGFEGDLRRRR